MSTPLIQRAAIIGLFAFLLYANTLNHDYVLDDGMFIVENHFTKAGVGGIKDILTHDAFVGFSGRAESELYSGGRYRPLSLVFFAIEYELFGLNPFFGHLLNALYYALLCMVLFFLLEKLFPSAKDKPWYFSVAFLSSLLFALHPIHTEVVANIKSRDEILAMLFSILSLWASVIFVESKKPKYLVLLAISLLAALLAKESAITFVAIIPLTLFVFYQPRVKQYVVVFIPVIFSLLVYFWMRKVALGIVLASNEVQARDLFHTPFMYATEGERLATVFYSWLKYLSLMIFPHPLTHDYYFNQIPITNWANPLVWLSLLFFFAIGLWAVVKIWKKNPLAYAILFFFLSFSVTSNLLIDLGLIMNERFMFMPSLGFTLLLGYLFSFFSGKKKGKTIILTLLIIIVSGYTLKSVTRNRDWKDIETLYLKDVKTSSNSARCNVIAGSILADKATAEKNKEKKKSLYTQARHYLMWGLEIYPNNGGGWGKLAELYIYLGNYPEAIGCYKQVFKYEPGKIEAVNNLYYIAQQYINNKQFEEAIAIYDSLIEAVPGARNTIVKKADALVAMKEYDKAVSMLLDAVAKDTSLYQEWNKLGEIYGRYYTRIDLSIKYLLESYRQKPDYLPVLENLGVAYGIQGNLQQSAYYLEAALGQKPDNLSVLSNLVQSYQLMNNQEKAAFYQAKINELNGKQGN